MASYQEKMKIQFDRKVKEKGFQAGDLVLKWDARRFDKGKYGNFDPLWFGPFRVFEAKGNNTFMLDNLEGDTLEMLVNGQFLMFYF